MTKKIWSDNAWEKYRSEELIKKNTWILEKQIKHKSPEPEPHPGHERGPIDGTDIYERVRSK